VSGFCPSPQRMPGEARRREGAQHGEGGVQRSALACHLHLNGTGHALSLLGNFVRLADEGWKSTALTPGTTGAFAAHFDHRVAATRDWAVLSGMGGRGRCLRVRGVGGSSRDQDGARSQTHHVFRHTAHEGMR